MDSGSQPWKTLHVTLRGWSQRVVPKDHFPTNSWKSGSQQGEKTLRMCYQAQVLTKMIASTHFLGQCPQGWSRLDRDHPQAGGEPWYQQIHFEVKLQAKLNLHFQWGISFLGQGGSTTHQWTPHDWLCDQMPKQKLICMEEVGWYPQYTRLVIMHNATKIFT